MKVPPDMAALMPRWLAAGLVASLLPVLGWVAEKVAPLRTRF
jgi:hypothetical protein